MTKLVVWAQTVPTMIRARHEARRGATMLEYVLLGLLVIGFGYVIFTVFGGSIKGAFTRISNDVNSR